MNEHEPRSVGRSNSPPSRSNSANRLSLRWILMRFDPRWAFGCWFGLVLGDCGLCGSNTSTECSAVNRRLVLIRPRDGINIRYTIYDTRLLDLHRHALKQPGVPAERHDRPEHDPVLVGQHRLHQDRRLEQRQPEDRRAWRYLRVRSTPHSLFFSFLLCSTPLCSALPRFLLTEMPRSRRSPCRETRHTGDLSPHPLVIPLGSFCSEGLFFPSTSGVSPFWSITSLSPLFRVRYTTFRGMCSGTLAGHPSRASLLLETNTVTDAFVTLFSFIYSPSHW